MADEMRVVYITKYVVGAGRIPSFNAKIGSGYAWVPALGNFKIGRDAFFSIAEAEAAGKKVIERKIASLEKQIKKLRSVQIKTDD